MANISEVDRLYMQRALGLAREGLGRCAPNPSVGCVIVKDGVVVGEGRTADAGRPHAEVVALAQAGARAKGATAYVTLEPCPMCAGAIKWAQLGKIVYGASDDKRGFMNYGKRMLHPKTKVEFGILNEACSELMISFFAEKR